MQRFALHFHENFLTLEFFEEVAQRGGRIDREIRGQDDHPRGPRLRRDLCIGVQHGHGQTLGLRAQRGADSLPEAAPLALEDQRDEFFTLFSERPRSLLTVGAQAIEMIGKQQPEDDQHL